MEKFADPTNDIAFKKVFSENIDSLKNFIETIISNVKDYPFSKNITQIEYLKTEQLPSLLQGKRSLCDLKVKDDQGNTYIIEMQKRNEEDYLQRIQYYASHAVIDQLEQGESHGTIKPVITISIMGRKCFNDDVPCISYHPYRETTTNNQLLLSQSHIFIELPKLKESEFNQDTIEWLKLFKEAPKLNKLPEVHNEFIKKAYLKLEQHNWTKDEMKAYIDARIIDDMEKSSIEHAREEGLVKGKKEARIEIAKNMLKAGISIDTIKITTGLNESEL